MIKDKDMTVNPDTDTNSHADIRAHRHTIDAQIEALLIVATEPTTVPDLAATLVAGLDEVSEALARLADFYDRTGRGFELRQVGAGWQYYTRADHDEIVARSVLEGRNATLTQAGLETLAVIAYLQPISRARIAAVRGVQVDGVVRTLIARDLVREIDRDESSGAGLLGTTSYFLQRLGLSSLDELPPLAPNLPDATLLDEELRRLASEPHDEALVPETPESESMPPESHAQTIPTMENHD